MNELLVILHNLIRWLVLILGIFVSVQAILGLIQKTEWSNTNRRTGLLFTIIYDIQILLGVLMYFGFSNWGLKAIFQYGMAGVMGQNEFRFFVVEHPFIMLFGFVFAHLGSSLPKKVDEPKRKFRRAAIFFGLATLFLLLGTPWGRPLFPGI
jgi:hypothetical protein